MSDYVEDGFLTAIREVKAITGQKQVNAVGYCIAGTTLHLTLALLAKRKDSSIKSATFFTALTDFSDQGEFLPFLQDDFIDGIEEEVKRTGRAALLYPWPHDVVPAVERSDLHARHQKLHAGRNAARL